MKKILSLMLAFLLVMGLVACGGEAAVTTGAGGQAASTEVGELPALRAGFGRVCITPKNKVALSSSKQATYDAVWDDVYMTCVALADADGNTVLLMTTDISYISSSLRSAVVRLASEASGVPEGNIVFACTHNHSGLEPSGSVSTLLKDSAKECAVAAVEDLSAATLSIGTAYPEGFNFVRHYVTTDGYYVGDGYYSPTGTPEEKHVRQPDNAMQMMRFDRAGKQSILLCNWQAHAVYSYYQEHLCADFIGPLRETVEAEADVLFAYFQGAAGNLNPWSEIGGNQGGEKSLGGMDIFGQKLAQYPLAILDSLTPVDGAGITLAGSDLAINVRRDSSETLAAAVAFEEAIAAGKKKYEAVAASGNQIHSIYGAEYVHDRPRKGSSNDITITAIRLGDVAFAVVPYEMFDDSGVYIKENSPFEMTFILGYANGRFGYMPSAACIEHGCYEWECGYYEAGTAEILVEEYLKLLNQLNP